MALASPEAGPFSKVGGGNTGLKLSVLKFQDTVEATDFVAIPVRGPFLGLGLAREDQFRS